MSYSPKAKFVQGKPVMVDFTPTVAVNAGDVIVSNNSLLIAHADIAANTLGAAAAGGGVYDFLNGASGAAISIGNLVRWDGTNLVPIGGTVVANLKIGPNVGATVTTNTATVRVLHVPGLNI